jgi:hypothetical protein
MTKGSRLYKFVQICICIDATPLGIVLVILHPLTYLVWLVDEVVLVVSILKFEPLCVVPFTG